MRMEQIGITEDIFHRRTTNHNLLHLFPRNQHSSTGSNLSNLSSVWFRPRNYFTPRQTSWNLIRFRMLLFLTSSQLNPLSLHVLFLGCTWMHIPWNRFVHNCQAFVRILSFSLSREIFGPTVPKRDYIAQLLGKRAACKPGRITESPFTT